jgi:hypothetical protein
MLRLPASAAGRQSELKPMPTAASRAKRYRDARRQPRWQEPKTKTSTISTSASRSIVTPALHRDDEKSRGAKAVTTFAQPQWEATSPSSTGRRRATVDPAPASSPWASPCPLLAWRRPRRRGCRRRYPAVPDTLGAICKRVVRLTPRRPKRRSVENRPSPPLPRARGKKFVYCST